MPTVCLTSLESGTEEEICFTQPTPLPERFNRLHGALANKVLRAETEQTEGRSDSPIVTGLVTVDILLLESNDGSQVRTWADNNGYTYREDEENRIIVSIPALQLTALAQVEGVDLIEPLIPFGMP